MTTATVTVTTSRIGRKPVSLPSGTDVKLQGNTLTAKGPKGSLSMNIHPYVEVTLDKSEISVKSNDSQKKRITGSKIKLYNSIVGTTRANIFNLIHGVTHGFQRKLVLVGVGYRAQAKGKVLQLNLGYSHETPFHLPEGITVETPTQTEILVNGLDKESVGLVAANIRKMRAPEPYKGKGIRYADEVIEIKETKKK